MHKYLIEMLECPNCHAELDWDITRSRGDRVETAQVSCLGCSTIYHVSQDIGQFLTPDLPREDLWEQVDSNLVQHLRQNPDVENRLMNVPLETLTPADQFFRALILDERGEYALAKVASDAAIKGIYTSDYLVCSESQINYAIDYLLKFGDPVVDLASGKGTLVERMAQRLSRKIVATDFSPRVLLGNRRRLEYFGLYDQVSFLAFDTRRTPFKDGVIKTLTTYLGLPNIREPGNLLRELRRIVSGHFLAISVFYPEDDKANKEVIVELDLSDLLFARNALEKFANAGWEIKTVNTCFGKARPTPTGVVMKGVGIDALPEADSTLEWSVVLAA